MDKRVEFAKAVTISNKNHHEKSMDTAAIQETNRQIEHIMQKRSYARRYRKARNQESQKSCLKGGDSCEENLEMPAHGSGCCHRLSFASAAQQTSENGQNRSDYLEVVLNG